MLQELSLAGNQLRQLPDCIGNLVHLEKLQLSGNYLESLPNSLCSLTALQVAVILDCLLLYCCILQSILPLSAIVAVQHGVAFMTTQY